MVLQRLGRLWRHERAQRPCSEPEIWIQMLPLAEKVFGNANEKELREAFGKSARVYAPYVLLRSLEQWRVRNAISSRCARGFARLADEPRGSTDCLRPSSRRRAAVPSDQRVGEGGKKCRQYGWRNQHGQQARSGPGNRQQRDVIRQRRR